MTTVLLVLALLSSCRNHQLGFLPDSSVCIGSNILLDLTVGPGEILVSDYIADPLRVDSVTSESESIALSLSGDKSRVCLYCGLDMPVMSCITFWVDGIGYALPVRANKHSCESVSAPNVDGLDSGCPVLKVQNASKGKFAFYMDGVVDRIWIYWDNIMLDSTFVSLDDNLLTVYIPHEAGNFAESELHVWASNICGVSNGIVVHIHDGDIVAYDVAHDL